MQQSEDSKAGVMMESDLYHWTPVTAEHWQDFEKLFGPQGACGGCWCMNWRLTHREYEEDKGEKNKNRMHNLIHSGSVPGILAYYKDEPIGWCSVEPRDQFVRLKNSRILKPVDDAEVWSVTCFYVDMEYRHHGLSIYLLQSAIEYVDQQGGKIIEGYPVDPQKARMPAIFAWTGLYSAFKTVGFKERARRSATRPIMRYTINKS